MAVPTRMYVHGLGEYRRRAQTKIWGHTSSYVDFFRQLMHFYVCTMSRICTVGYADTGSHEFQAV
jgi:hypothetical protein